MPCSTCRDALALLRKRHGLGASPAKRKQKQNINSVEDELALEQVCCVHLCLRVAAFQYTGWFTWLTCRLLLQMIVGVLLFTPLLFLLPTTAVYYAMSLLLFGCVLLTCWALKTVCQVASSNLAFSCWCWLFKPHMVPGKEHFIILTMQTSLQQWRLHVRFLIWGI